MNPPGRRLTAGQLRALRLVAAGFSNRQIAVELNLASPHAADMLLHRAYQVLGANDRAHAVALCYQRGIIKIGDQL